MRQEAMSKIMTKENLKAALERLTRKQAQMVFDRRKPAEIASVGTRIEEIRARLRSADEESEGAVG